MFLLYIKLIDVKIILAFPQKRDHLSNCEKLDLATKP